MRDNYDDKFKDASHTEFTCAQVMSFKRVFFGTGVNANIEDKILKHLLTCKKCRLEFNAYAREVGYKKFDLIKYSISFVEDNKWMADSQTREYLSEVHENKEMRVLSKPWTRAANQFDISKLMNLKVFRDLSMEYNSPTGMDYSDFIKYLSLKLAKKIDHLEECLLKEVPLKEEQK